MLKLIPHIPNASWVIKQSVGTVPVILGNKLKTTFYRTDRCGCLPWQLSVPTRLAQQYEAHVQLCMRWARPCVITQLLSAVIERRLRRCALPSPQVYRGDCRRHQHQRGGLHHG